MASIEQDLDVHVQAQQTCTIIQTANHEQDPNTFKEDNDPGSQNDDDCCTVCNNDCFHNGCYFKTSKELESKLGFNFKYPGLFVKSIWYTDREIKKEDASMTVYLIWASLWMLYHGGMFVCELRRYCSDTDYRRTYFIYLSNWSYVLLVITNFVDVCCVFYIILRPISKVEPSTEFQAKQSVMPLCLKVNWLMFTIMNTSHIVVTVGYYAFGDAKLNFTSVVYHIMNTIYISLNHIVSAKPVRPIHGVYPMGYLTVYFIFSFFYQIICDQEPIYKALDWSDFIITLLKVLGALCSAFFLHAVVFYFIFFVRQYGIYCNSCKNLELRVLDARKPDQNQETRQQIHHMNNCIVAQSTSYQQSFQTNTVISTVQNQNVTVF